MFSTVFLVKNLSGNSNAVVYYLFAILVINLFFGEGDIDLSIWQENTNYFKARLVGFLNPAVILTGCYLFKIEQKKMVPVIFILYSVICFIFDARSNGLVFFISSALLYIKTSNIRLSGIKIVGLIFVLLTLSYTAYIFYVDQVLNHGLGGTNSKQQLGAATNPYNPFELLYYGRTDFFVLIEAIADKPFFGHGSWGKDPSSQYTNAALLGTGDFGDSAPGYIKAHSVFLGTWAYAGFVGFIATLYMYVFVFKLIIKVYRSKLNSIYLPLLIVTSVEMLWAYFFSPIQVLRISFPFFAAVALTEFAKLKITRLLTSCHQQTVQREVYDC
jgi:O-antigen ligase